MKTEKEKMLGGELYNAYDPELTASRVRAKSLCKRLNDLDVGRQDERARLMRELFSHPLNNFQKLIVEPVFFCDYGVNIRFGDNVYFNHNCVILDAAPVVIGSNVLFGPGVHLYTSTHPLDPDVRRSGLESAHPIEIGSDVWMGGGAIVCPGVKIGSGAVIGAGSVVTKDIPEGAVAVGNPCREIKRVRA